MLTDSVIYLMLLVHFYSLFLKTDWTAVVWVILVPFLHLVSVLFSSPVSVLLKLSTLSLLQLSSSLTFQWQQQTDLELLIQTNETYKDEPLNGHVARVAKGLVR